MKIPRGPAAVLAETVCITTGKPGRVNSIMTLEPEDLPVFCTVILYER